MEWVVVVESWLTASAYYHVTRMQGTKEMQQLLILGDSDSTLRQQSINFG